MILIEPLLLVGIIRCFLGNKVFGYEKFMQKGCSIYTWVVWRMLRNTVTWAVNVWVLQNNNILEKGVS